MESGLFNIGVGGVCVLGGTRIKAFKNLFGRKTFHHMNGAAWVRILLSVQKIHRSIQQ